jgi:hypothetical protein
VPAAARRIAGLDGAPEALALLELLGLTEAASLGDNARATGLEGREALTLETLFRHTWRLHRDAEVLTSPCPERVPVTSAVVAAVLRSGSSPGEVGGDGVEPPPRSAPAPAGGPETLLLWSAEGTRLDEAELVSTIGFVAGVFGPLTLRVAARGDPQVARQLVATARERFDLSERRVQEGRRVAGRGLASIEVLSSP